MRIKAWIIRAGDAEEISVLCRSASQFPGPRWWRPCCTLRITVITCIHRMYFHCHYMQWLVMLLIETSVPEYINHECCHFLHQNQAYTTVSFLKAPTQAPTSAPTPVPTSSPTQVSCACARSAQYGEPIFSLNNSFNKILFGTQPAAAINHGLWQPLGHTVHIYCHFLHVLGRHLHLLQHPNQHLLQHQWVARAVLCIKLCWAHDMHHHAETFLERLQGLTMTLVLEFVDLWHFGDRFLPLSQHLLHQQQSLLQ